MIDDKENKRNDSDYNKSKENFNKERKLYHFTDFNAVKKIFGDMKFRMSKISSNNLNDGTEKETIDAIWKDKIFIMCFTNCMKEYFWENYAKGKKQGVCIEVDMGKFKYNKIVSKDGIVLEKKTDYLHEKTNDENDWIIHDISGLEVVYKDNPSKDCYYDKELITLYEGCNDVGNNKPLQENFKYYNNQGYSKDRKKWDIENEYRIRCTIRPKGSETYTYKTNILYYRPNFEHLYIDLSKQETVFKIIINKEFECIEEIHEFCKNKGLKLEVI